MSLPIKSTAILKYSYSLTEWHRYIRRVNEINHTNLLHIIIYNYGLR